MRRGWGWCGLPIVDEEGFVQANHFLIFLLVLSRHVPVRREEDNDGVQKDRRPTSECYTDPGDGPMSSVSEGLLHRNLGLKKLK